MADTPQFLTLRANRDDRRRVELYTRRVVVGVIALLALLALLNVFGQRPVASVADAEAAKLEVTAPKDLRGGVFYMGRFEIEAKEEIARATLVLDEGWLESMHINTIEPSPVGESSRDGALALDFGHVASGDRIVAYLQFQVNPTNVGRRSQSVALYDDETFLAEVGRTVTIFP